MMNIPRINVSNSSQASIEEQKNKLLPDTTVKGTQSLHRNTPNRNLRHRKRAVWLILLYLPVLILPWVFTCIMMFRPIMKGSYINQIGEYSMADIYRMQRWHTATDILSGIASVLAVPTVSALLAHGAVVYTQRRKAGQDLNIRQMFTFADKGWTDIPILWFALWNPSQKRSSRYLWFGAFLVLLAAIQPPLRQLLVQDEMKTVVTCNDQPAVNNNDDPTCDLWGVHSKVVGYDPEPQLLELCPQNIVIQRTLDKIIDARPPDIQPHLWRVVNEDENLPVQDQSMNSLSFYYSPGVVPKEKGSYFVSSLPNGTTTGVLREHAIRMDSDVQCAMVNSFPDNCAGDRPFAVNFTSPVVEVSVCAEGSYDRSPWNNTRDKQEITERLWMQTNVNVDAIRQYKVSGTILDNATNFTLRCDATSRRGWFELGNYQNDYSHQPMLETWPSSDAMKNGFNDIGTQYSATYWPIKEEPAAEWNPLVYENTLDSFGTRELQTPGPLMSAALALFGNGSFLHTAREATKDQQRQTAISICEQSRIPFILYGSRNLMDAYKLTEKCLNLKLENEDAEPLMLPGIVGAFMQFLNSPVNAKQCLEITAFFATEALLMTTAEVELQSSRDVYTSAGYTILKPQKSMLGLVVISCLIGLQVAGLLVLVLFIYSAPSWTVTLDALTLARIGAQLHNQGKELDSASVSGVVGIGEREEEVRQPGVSSSGRPIQKTVNILALGESGVISRSSARRSF